MKVLLVSKDGGNYLNAGLPVAQAFRTAGHDVTYYLDYYGSALQYLEQPFPTARIPADEVSAVDLVFDAVVTTLSASGEPNLEQTIVERALEQHIPVYGLEEVPGGRRNPGWKEIVPRFTRLFTALPGTDKDLPVITVGPFHLGKYKGVDWKQEAQAGWDALQLNKSPLVWVLTHPNPESPGALLDIGQTVAEIQCRRKKEIRLLVTRHPRERFQQVPWNAEAYHYAFDRISKWGVELLDCSEEYDVMAGPSSYQVSLNFRPRHFPTRSQLLAMCRQSGVGVTGFCTDVFLDALYLGVPSVLSLNEYYWGGLLTREKGLGSPEVPFAQRVAGSVGDLYRQLDALLFDPASRQEHCQKVQREFPLPAHEPAELVVQHIVNGR